MLNSNSIILKILFITVYSRYNENCKDIFLYFHQNSVSLSPKFSNITSDKSSFNANGDYLTVLLQLNNCQENMKKALVRCRFN